MKRISNDLIYTNSNNKKTSIENNNNKNNSKCSRTQKHTHRIIRGQERKNIEREWMHKISEKFIEIRREVVFCWRQLNCLLCVRECEFDSLSLSVSLAKPFYDRYFRAHKTTHNESVLTNFQQYSLNILNLSMDFSCKRRIYTQMYQSTETDPSRDGMQCAQKGDRTYREKWHCRNTMNTYVLDVPNSGKQITFYLSKKKKTKWKEGKIRKRSPIVN